MGIKIEKIDLELLDPSKNKVDEIFEKILHLIKSADNTEDEKKILVSTNKELNTKDQDSLFEHFKKNQAKKIPHYWMHEIKYTPKINSIEKYFINKNNFSSKKEFVESYFKWIKENCYPNVKNWTTKEGVRTQYLYKPENELQGVFGIYIYDF